jgi:hypothetical protein
MGHYSLFCEVVCALAEQAGQGKTVSLIRRNEQMLPLSRPIGQENGAHADLNFINSIFFKSLAAFKN